MSASVSTPETSTSRYETELAVLEYIFKSNGYTPQEVFKKFGRVPRTVVHEVLDTLSDAQIIFIVHDGTYRWQCEQTLEGAKLFIRCRYQRGN
jgi:hypothetical protein